jgi:hypothetical protein
VLGCVKESFAISVLLNTSTVMDRTVCQVFIIVYFAKNTFEHISSQAGSLMEEKLYVFRKISIMAASVSIVCEGLIPE